MIMPQSILRLDPDHVLVRPTRLSDVDALANLLMSHQHSHINLPDQNLMALVEFGIGVVLTVRGRIEGCALAGIPLANQTWLRAVGLSDRIAVDEGLALLLPALHQQLAQAHLHACYYGGDAAADGWLAPHLLTYGYQHDTYVITYAKQDALVPHVGNQQVALRTATFADLETIVDLDHRCFEPHWIKPFDLMEAIFTAGHRFVVAQIDRQLVGYTLATAYTYSQQIHLVRIAVAPEYRHHGIGARLLVDLIDQAKAHRSERITLNTQEYNPARRLYESFGFQRTGERQLILRLPLAE
ncbi:MAG: GNAT family N-acetyltransferase [Roseiflexaceae bacterium]